MRRLPDGYSIQRRLSSGAATNYVSSLTFNSYTIRLVQRIPYRVLGTKQTIGPGLQYLKCQKNHSYRSIERQCNLLYTKHRSLQRSLVLPQTYVKGAIRWLSYRNPFGTDTMRDYTAELYTVMSHSSGDLFGSFSFLYLISSPVIITSDARRYIVCQQGSPICLLRYSPAL